MLCMKFNFPHKRTPRNAHVNINRQSIQFVLNISNQHNVKKKIHFSCLVKEHGKAYELLQLYYESALKTKEYAYKKKDLQL